MWANEYGDNKRWEKVRKGKGIRSGRDEFLNVANNSEEQLRITRQNEGDNKRRA